MVVCKCASSSHIRSDAHLHTNTTQRCFDPPHLDKDCCEQRRVTQYLRPFHMSDEDPHKQSHQNCRHNLVDAMARRHYKVRLPRPSQAGRVELEAAFKWLKRIARKSGLSPGMRPWSEEKVVATRTPSKRLAYQRGFEKIADFGLRRRMSAVHVFLKHEKGPVSDKAPRLIQHRDPAYCAALARYLAKVEHHIYNLEFNGVRIFGKALNPRQTAEGIAAAEGYRKKYFMLDHSSFDAHVSGYLLDLEHRFYLWLFRGDPELQKLLDWQRQNKCHFHDGASWHSKPNTRLVERYCDKDGEPYLVRSEIPHTNWPGRMSGDYNTGLGNSIINALVLYSWGLRNGLASSPRFAFQVNGDDCWGTVPAEFQMPSPKQFEAWGMTTKLEGIGWCPEEVSYCQARPVFLEDGWMMVRDYQRVLNRLPYTVRSYGGQGWIKYARGVAACERALSSGVPILSAIAAGLRRDLGDGPMIIDRSDERAYAIAMQVANYNRTITDAARDSYHLAYGIDPIEQRVLERRLVAHDWRTDLMRDGPQGYCAKGPQGQR